MSKQARSPQKKKARPLRPAAVKPTEAVAKGHARRPNRRSKHSRSNGFGFGLPAAPTEFTQRPPHVPPYLPIDLGMEEMGRKDDERVVKEAARHGWDHASIKQAHQAGQSFTFVQQMTGNLPFIVYFGGKDIKRGSEAAHQIELGVAPIAIAAGLLGVSAVAGGGDGAMSLCQRLAANGIELLKKTKYRRLFPKAGVAGVLLGIEEEAPNPYVTADWMVRPTRNLLLRTLRLMRVGFPLLVVCTEGGDSTMLEVFATKALTKPTIVKQTDTPFTYVQPEFVFVENESDPFWHPFMAWYERAMVRGDGKRAVRKRAEFRRLREGVILPSRALVGAKMAIARMDIAAKRVYGAGLVETWEHVNHARFWPAVQDLTVELLAQ